MVLWDSRSWGGSLGSACSGALEQESELRGSGAGSCGVLGSDMVTWSPNTIGMWHQSRGPSWVLVAESREPQGQGSRLGPGCA